MKKKIWRVLTIKNKMTKGSGVRWPTHNRAGAKPESKPLTSCQKQEQRPLPNQHPQHLTLGWDWVTPAHLKYCWQGTKALTSPTLTDFLKTDTSIATRWIHWRGGGNLNFLMYKIQIWNKVLYRINPGKEMHSGCCPCLPCAEVAQLQQGEAEEVQTAGTAHPQL